MDPYVGEIRMFAGNFPPVGWAFCDGQLLAIAGNEFLFQTIGTTYGGDGVSTFALPDLRGRIPMNQGNSYPIGTIGGHEQVTISFDQMPSHSHSVRASSQYGDGNLPDGNIWAKSPFMQFASGNDVTVSGSFPPAIVGNAGAGMAHDNMMPYLTVSFIISLFGVFPTQN